MVNVETASPQRPETEVIADLVEKYLGRHQPQDCRIVVRRQSVRLGTRRWLVEVDVVPRNLEIRSDDLADRIIGANEELDRDYPRYIRLMQMVPGRDELL